MLNEESIEHRRRDTAAVSEQAFQSGILQTGNRAHVFLERAPAAGSRCRQFGIVALVGFRQILEAGAVFILDPGLEEFVEANPEAARPEFEIEAATFIEIEVRHQAVGQFFWRQVTRFGQRGNLFAGLFLQPLEFELFGDAVEVHQRDIAANHGQHVQSLNRPGMCRLARPFSDHRRQTTYSFVVSKPAQSAQSPVFLADCAFGQPDREQVPGEGSQTVGVTNFT